LGVYPNVVRAVDRPIDSVIVGSRILTAHKDSVQLHAGTSSVMLCYEHLLSTGEMSPAIDTWQGA
jgi:hypothetical protein